jgi:hypothetical protein
VTQLKAKLKKRLFFSITYKKVKVSLLTDIFFNNFSKISNLSEEDIKGLLITKLRFLFSFNND